MELTPSQFKKICKKFSVLYQSSKYLAAGAFNECYLLTTDSAKYVVKVAQHKGYLKKEYQWLNLIKSGMGPQAFLFDQSKKIMKHDYLVMEFIEGKHLPKKLTKKQAMILGKWIKHLHSIKSSKVESDELKRIYSLKHWLSGQIMKFKQTRDLPFQKQISELLDESEMICSQYDHIFHSRRKFSLIHVDLANDNCFLTKKGLKCIDWEFAGFTLHETDLIRVLDHYAFSKTTKMAFLKSYGFTFSKKAFRQLYLVRLLRTIGDVHWLIERMQKARKGELSKRLGHQDLEVLSKRTEKFIRRAKKTVKMLHLL